MAISRVDPDDSNFLRHALRVGTWERFEHPTKGDTLTLQIGQFPVMSIHAIMVDGPPNPTVTFLDDLRAPETVALLLSQVALLHEQLQTAASVIAELGPRPGGKEHDGLVVSLHKDYCVVCRCGYREDEFKTSAAAQDALDVHIATKNALSTYQS